LRLTKRYILNLDGQEMTAEIATEDGRVEIQLADDTGGPVDARPVLNGRAWSLRQDNRQYLVYLTALDGKGSVAATLAGRPVQMTALDELRALALADIEHHDGGGVLVADIPGLVVEIRAEVGQKVERGQPVIVVEAMKMQNELAAGISGVVSEIPVTAGQAVNPGDRLVVIEPEEA